MPKHYYIDPNYSRPVRCGYVDHAGYLYCSECRPVQTEASDRAVWTDGAPHNAERCDDCGQVLANSPVRIA